MKIATFPFAVLRFQYRVVRFPLGLIEERVFARMNSEAPARLLYERTLGTLDATVGNALDDPELAKRGAAFADRSDALARAARLDTAATQKEEHADAEVKAKREQSLEDRKEATAKKAREIQETLHEADVRKDAAAASAQKRTAAAKQQVDEVASKRKEAAETAKRDEQARIKAAEKKVTEAAEAKLDHAQAKRGKAATARAQADRIEELADVEKQKRKTVRASTATT
ncbi:MAG: hypothetical protein JWM76_4522 [Pseudonocardiales bacterium]|nr:hypothetical protein [Pseudonocardiales bacterium]